MTEPIEESAWVRLRYRMRAWWRRMRPVCRPLQWPVLSAVALLTVALGCWGFHRYYAGGDPPRGFLDLLYRSLQLFVLESGWVEGARIPWQLQVARYVAPLLAARAAVGALAVIFHEQLQQFLMLFIHDHVVVCGAGRKGMQLVSDFCRRGYRVVVIEWDKENDNIPACRDEGAMVLAANAADRDVLRRARVHRARYVVAVCGDDRANLEIAVQTHRLVEEADG